MLVLPALLPALPLPAWLTVQAMMESLDRAAQHLPFHVDDYDRASEAYVAARAGDPKARRTAELWAFCYVRRYFLAKFVRDRAYPVVDLDQLVGKAYGRVMDKWDTVKNPERFAAYLSVLCRNQYIDYLRARKADAYLEEAEHVHPTADPVDEAAVHDRPLAQRTLTRAIERLPDSLREVARLRLLENKSYEHVEAATGYTVPTARAYVHKALQKLRHDADVRALYAELLDA